MTNRIAYEISIDGCFWLVSSRCSLLLNQAYGPKSGNPRGLVCGPENKWHDNQLSKIRVNLPAKKAKLKTQACDGNFNRRIREKHETLNKPSCFDAITNEPDYATI